MKRSVEQFLILSILRNGSALGPLNQTKTTTDVAQRAFGSSEEALRLVKTMNHDRKRSRQESVLRISAQ
jgi:hypothetical protein